MAINGFHKTTLLDYPGKLAATIFLGYCNFRCPYCHNSGLVLSAPQQAVIPAKEVLKVLKKRKNILEGVCITGGEPTLDPNLFPLIEQIKAEGYLVKLDTNGSHPWVLKKLVNNRMVDMVAMDIKSSPEHYGLAAGIQPFDIAPIMESAEFLKEGSLPYEFRTTVVRELHTEEDFVSISRWLAGSKSYFLQAYRDSPQVIHPGFSSYTKEELEIFRGILSKTMESVHIRGVD